MVCKVIFIDVFIFFISAFFVNVKIFLLMYQAYMVDNPYASFFRTFTFDCNVVSRNGVVFVS